MRTCTDSYDRQVTKSPSAEYNVLFSKGGIAVKVVVIRSPKFLSGILRMIFGIQKETE
ncbi:MAG: stage V sporulation protein SpoVM [Ruminococcus sp.]|nr:stage V sporulation protein SpoVM [Ruminococcus sp.]